MPFHLGDRVKQIRTSQGLTQQKLAEKINKSVGFIGQVERGRIFPSYKTLIEIMKALNIDEKSFFSAGTPEEYEDALREALISSELSADMVHYLRESAKLILKVLKDST